MCSIRLFGALRHDLVQYLVLAYRTVFLNPYFFDIDPLCSCYDFSEGTAQ